MTNNIAIKLLTKLCSVNYEDDDTNHENILHIIEQFKEYLPDYDINKLDLVSKFYDNNYPHVFRLDSKLIGLKKDVWFEVPVIHLSTESPDNNFGIKLIDDCDNTISYELYPFEQSNEISLETIIKKNELQKVNPTTAYKSFNKCLDTIDIKYEWINDMFLYIGEEGYYIVKNHKIISAFLDPETHFQSGDFDTICYLTNDGNLVIHNCGDVSSIVIIKYNHIK